MEALPEPLKGSGRQGFWLERRMRGGRSVRPLAAACAGGHRAEGWVRALSRDERRALCRASGFAPPPGREPG